MRGLLKKRIPTILGIILILLGIPLTTFVAKNQTVFKSKASNSQEPRNVKITNITDTSFTITYQTESPSTGSISYGNDKKLGEFELEDLDREKGSFSPKKIHSMSVKKLTPATRYYLTIISGSNTYLNNDAPFEVTTGNTISSSSANQQIIKGKVVLPDGNAPSEALIYLSTENSQLLSNVADKDGKFSFSLKGLRTEDLSSYFNVNENTVFKIVATDGFLKSTVSTSLNQKNSVPIITLSNDYDFIQDAPLIASKSAESSGSSSFPSIAPSEKNLKPEIISPKDNQSFTDQKPQFRGTSLPNEKVEIIINSDEQITARVTADINGNWTYKPPNNLSPGAHTITIKARDSSGILTTVMQSFTVLAAETTPTPTIPATPTQNVFPTLIPLPTQTPTILPSPTAIPSFFPSPIIAPIESQGGLPPTGTSPILLIAGGITATLTGLVLLFFTRKISL